MKSNIPSRIAEIIYALTMGTFGFLHFKNADMLVGYKVVPDYMPADPKVWVYVVGGCLIAAAIAIIINKFKMMACYLLALLLLIFVFALHLKPAMDGNLGDLLKDAGLAMGAILIGNNSSR